MEKVELRSGLAKAWWMGVLAECCLAEFGFFHFAIEQETWYASVGGFQILAHLISDRFQFLLAAWAFAPVVGLLCVFTHWLFVRPAD